MRANNCAKNTRNPNSCSKVIAWTRICGRRRRTNRYKNSHPPVFRGDLNSTLSSHCEIAHRWMPQNLNSLRRSDPYMRQYTRPSFLKVICTVINPILLIYLLEDNSFWPDQRQANTWTNAEILLIRTLGTNSSEIKPYEIQQMSYFFI